MKFRLKLGQGAGFALGLLYLASSHQLLAQTPTVILSSPRVEFSYQQGTSVITPQRVQVLSNPPNLPFTVTAVPATPPILIHHQW